MRRTLWSQSGMREILMGSECDGLSWVAQQESNQVRENLEKKTKKRGLDRLILGKKTVTMGNKTNQRVEEEGDLFACFLCVCEIAKLTEW